MKRISLICFMLISLWTKAQQQKIDSVVTPQHLTFKYQSLLIPTVLIGYGVIGLESHTLKNLNLTTRNEINEHIDSNLTIDDFSQYSSFVSVYTLNALGVKGKHNMRDRTIILASAYLIMGGTVNIIKHSSTVERPDGSTTNSFPSGHTATAFMGAEFLFQEYKDISIWYGVAGYAIAAGTGAFRMYNNRHWLTDVAAGAGIGILSTKIAYWIYPGINNLLFKNKKTTAGVIFPYSNGKEHGVSLSVHF